MTSKDRALRAFAMRKKGLLYREIGDFFDVSPNRASQIVTKGEMLETKRKAGEEKEKTFALLRDRSLHFPMELVSVRTANCLKNVGAWTVGEVLEFATSGDALKTPMFGKKSLHELLVFLGRHNLLGAEVEE